MKLRPLLSVLCLFAVPLCADVTQRFAMRIEPGPDLPPQLTEPIAKELLGQTDALSFEVRLKGSRAATRIGSFYSVSDFDGAIVTVLDNSGQRYATAGADEYMRISGPLTRRKPEATSRAPADIRISEPVHATGKTKKLHGIEVAEHEFTMTAPMTDGALLNIRVALWCASETERVHNPAILELQRYADRAYLPSSLSSNLAGAIGSADEKFVGDLVKAVTALGVCMETRLSYLTPDGDVLMTLVQEMSEFSTAPIPDSVFAVPRGYATARMEELLAKALTTTPVKAAPVVDEPAADPDRPTLRRRR